MNDKYWYDMSTCIERNGHPPADTIFDVADNLEIPRTKAADGTETFHNWARAVWTADGYDQASGDQTEQRDAQIAIARTFLGIGAPCGMEASSIALIISTPRA